MMIWSEYKTIDMNSDNTDWNKINEELKIRIISGKLLQKSHELTFELIGLLHFHYTPL